MTPTIKYGPEENAAYIRLSSAKVLDSAEVSPDVAFDYDAEGRIVGIELLDAKSQLPADALTQATGALAEDDLAPAQRRHRNVLRRRHHRKRKFLDKQKERARSPFGGFRKGVVPQAALSKR